MYFSGSHVTCIYGNWRNTILWFHRYFPGLELNLFELRFQEKTKNQWSGTERYDSFQNIPEDHWLSWNILFVSFSFSFLVVSLIISFFFLENQHLNLEHVKQMSPSPSANYGFGWIGFLWSKFTIFHAMVWVRIFHLTSSCHFLAIWYRPENLHFVSGLTKP